MDSFSHYRRKFTEQVILTEKQIYILEGYLKLAEVVGIPNVTFQKVADHLNISLGSIHYHFGNKDGPNLMDCAIMHVSQESIKFINFYLDRALNNGSFKGIETYINILYDFCRNYPHYGKLWLYYYYLSAFEGKQRDSNQEYMILMRNRIEQVLTLAIGKGIYTNIGDIKFLSEKLHFAIIGALIIAGGDKKDPLFENAQTCVVQSCEAIIVTHQEEQ